MDAYIRVDKPALDSLPSVRQREEGRLMKKERLRIYMLDTWVLLSSSWGQEMKEPHAHLIAEEARCIGCMAIKLTITREELLRRQ